VAIVVEDSGTRLSEKVMERLARWLTRQSGMGLGLFLVRSAVENHRGKIYFATSRLKGWKISVWLPNNPFPRN
jgi:signal transduction histidine kinase